MRKSIPPEERLIVALDVPDADQARMLVEQLGDAVRFYKLGLEIFLAEGYFDLLRELVDAGKKVLVDLKFFDVPNTVESAVRQLSKHDAYFVTVHGTDEILKAACKSKNGLKVLAVTVLTSFDQADVEALGFPETVTIPEIVLSRAKRALEIGCDGVISSGLEASALRDAHGESFVIVVPGIRPGDNREDDDQKRTVDVEEAFANGADYIVVGRPIRNAPDPRAEADDYQRRIRNIFSGDPS